MICFYDLVSYGLQQLKGQLNIIWNAKPVAEVIQEGTLPDSLIRKLKLIEEIRKFSSDSLGLKNSDNYSTFYDQKGKPALWVLTACEPFNMKAYEWYFPFLGNVSYKGFFIKEKGIPEADELKAKGYDIEYSPTSAWSTLGWFKDPVLSGMLRRSEGHLAELIIHELTHSTVYLPGSVEYNENLATLVGEEGAQLFLKNHFGENSEELISYQNDLHDEEIYGRYMVDACAKLDSFYTTLNLGQDTETLHRKKYFFIVELITGIRKLPLKKPSRYRFEFPGDKIPGNAWFMGFKRYRSSQDEFRSLLDKHNRDLKAFISHIREKH